MQIGKEMKGICTFLATVCVAMTCDAQTLTVRAGGVYYNFPASLVGDMMFSNGNVLTINDKSFDLRAIDGMEISDGGLTNCNVCYSYGDIYQNVVIATEQTAMHDNPTNNPNNVLLYDSYLGGLCLRFQMEGIERLELESVDAYHIAGNAQYSHDATPDTNVTEGGSIVEIRPQSGTFVPGKDYYVSIFPCDLSGGYRLSIFKHGLVAHYFGVHQKVEVGKFITPTDLDESELSFDDPDAPLVEEERPGLNSATKAALVEYQKNPTAENKNALLEQMGIRYDKVVARKKAKLRELEREAKHQSLVDEMQAIVDEMVDNRDVRLEQQFLRLIDPREDDNPNDEWLVLRGATANDAYIGFAPVTNEEYVKFKDNHSYPDGEGRFPIVNVSVNDALAYCEWLEANDNRHSFRLPTDEEWILGAGHMPKDVKMNSDHVESGITSVDAYSLTKGACRGIDFWGNCWEWTSTKDPNGLNVVKGGSWDSSRDACRSEYSDDVRDPSKIYGNVGFRIVRVSR